MNRFLLYTSIAYYVFTEDLVRALNPKSRYFTPSSFIIRNLRSCKNNPQTRFPCTDK